MKRPDLDLPLKTLLDRSERDVEIYYKGEPSWLSQLGIWVGLVLPFAFAIFAIYAALS